MYSAQQSAHAALMSIIILAQAAWLDKSICARLKLVDVPLAFLSYATIGEPQKKEQNIQRVSEVLLYSVASSARYSLSAEPQISIIPALAAVGGCSTGTRRIPYETRGSNGWTGQWQ